MVKRKFFIIFVLSLLLVFFIYLNQKHGYFIFNYPSFNETYVSFRFDDGLKSQKESFKILKENNMTGSVYIITSKPNSEIDWEKEYYLNWSEIEEISTFMEIGSHTNTHPDLTIDPYFEKEIIESKKILEEKGFEVKTFVYPGGKYNPKVIKIVEENYECASTQDVGTNVNPIRPHLLKDFTFRSSNNKDTLKRVIKKGRWNILTFHDIGNFSEVKVNGIYKYTIKQNAIPLELFEQIVDYVKENKIKVITISEGCDMFKNEK